MPSVCEVEFYLFRSDGLAVVPVKFFAKVLSDGTIGLTRRLSERWRKPDEVFAKVLADGTVGYV